MPWAFAWAAEHTWEQWELTDPELCARLLRRLAWADLAGFQAAGFRRMPSGALHHDELAVTLTVVFLADGLRLIRKIER